LESLEIIFLMKVICFGNLGYVGTVIDDYLKKKFHYTGFDNRYFDKCKVIPFERVKNQIYGDVRELEDFNLNGFDSLIYLAALSNDPIGKEFSEVTHQINQVSAIKLAVKAKKNGVKKFVYASSCSVYGRGGNDVKKESDPLNPLTAYAKSKIEAENELRKLSSSTFNVICLRFATACGYSNRLRLDLVLNDFVASAFFNNQIKLLSNGESWRPLIDVNDMARAIEWAVKEVNSFENNFLSLNIGSANWNFKIIDLAKLVSKVLGNIPLKYSNRAFDDPRSYKVDFSLFKKLAPNFQPQVKIDDCIKKLHSMIEKNIPIKDYNSEKLIRLSYLKKLIYEKKINKNLTWI